MDIRDEWLLEEHMPSATQPNIYYWYYATQTLHHFGGDQWESWNLKMRDVLVEILRAIWERQPPPASAKFGTAFAFMGYEPLRADIPVYLAGLSPGMLRLAGEIAEGVVLWLCNPNYVRDVVVPAVREGREKAGKPLEGFDIVAAVPSAVTDKPDEVVERMRGELQSYFGLP